MYSTPGTVPYSRKSSEYGETSGISESEVMPAYLRARRSTPRSAPCIYRPLPRPGDTSLASRQCHRITGANPETKAEKMGDDLLSHGVYPAVPSALAGLTSLFGMGRGVSPPPSSPFQKSGKYSILKPAHRRWPLKTA